MRASGFGFSLAVVLFAASVANAAPPAAPQVTMGADIKLLRFDWDPVPGASFYRLWVRPGGSRYIAASERIPASITQAEHPIAVHLQNWVRTRYVVTACNASGCTGSRALNPRLLMLDTIGYLKASNTDAGDFFGRNVVLSADGYTLAVGASAEASNASGVNGDQTNNLSQFSGAVYVFRRRANSWHQEAYLKAGENQPLQSFGVDLVMTLRGIALSADGSMLAASAVQQAVDEVQNAGAVYVFQRIQNVWFLTTTLHAPMPAHNDYFGTAVDMSDDGRTLKVNSVGPPDGTGRPQFSIHIFVRPANTWRHAVTLFPFYPGDLCQSSRLSGDGQTLVSSCIANATEYRMVTMKRAGDAWTHAPDLPIGFFQSRQPIALNRDATVMALSEGTSARLVGVYRWVGGRWVRESGFPGFPSGTPSAGFGWGWDLALSSEGDLLGITDPVASEAGAGISPVATPGTTPLGAAYLYARNKITNTWALRSVVKSANPGFRDSFGSSISLSATGRTLAVGAQEENSSATGIDGERANEEAPNAGAAYLY